MKQIPITFMFFSILFSFGLTSFAEDKEEFLPPILRTLHARTNESKSEDIQKRREYLLQKLNDQEEKSENKKNEMLELELED